MPKITIPDPEGRVPCTQEEFWRALLTLKFDTVEQLNYTEAHLEAVDESGLTPLARAVKRGLLPLVWLLGRLGANPEARSADGHTPLMHAIAHGHLYIVKYLITEKKVVVDITNHEFRACLLKALYYKHNLVLAYFEKNYHFFDLNTITNGVSMFAILNGWIEAFEIFLHQIDPSDVPPVLGVAIQIAHCNVIAGAASAEAVYQHLSELLPNISDGRVITFTLAVINTDLRTVRRLVEIEKINSQAFGARILYWALSSAVKNKKFSVYLYLRRNGLSLNSVDADGNTLLHYATKLDDLACVQYLCTAGEALDVKIDVNALDKDNNSPLMLAIKYKCKVGLVRFLVEQLKATIDMENPRFFFAVCQATAEVADYLFTSIGKVNPFKDQTPLEVIIKNEWLDVLKLYCQSNLISPTYAMIAAISMRRLHLIPQLLHSADRFEWHNIFDEITKRLTDTQELLTAIEFLFTQKIPFTENDLIKLLYKAAILGSEGKPQLFDFLIKKGIKINSDNGSESALYLAIYENSLPAAEFLVNRGADMTNVLNDFTAIRQAALRGYGMLLEFFVKRLIDDVKRGNITSEKASVIMTDGFFGALHNKAWEIILLFLTDDILPSMASLEKGFLNALEAKQDTLLQKIISIGVKARSSYFDLSNLIRLNVDFELIRHRVEHCPINLELTDGKEGTALCVAAARGNRLMVEYLLSRGANPAACDCKGNNLLHFAVMQGWTDLVKQLIQKMDPSLPNKEGCTLTILAAMHNRPDVLELLVGRKEVDLEAYSSLYGTAVGAAARYGHLDIVIFLEKYGAKLNTSNKFGNSPCHLAVNYLVSRKRLPDDRLALLKKIIQYFLDHGFDINSTNLQGNTVLHLAANSNDVHQNEAHALIDFLRSKGADVNIRNKDGHTAYQIAQLRSDCDELFPDNTVDQESPIQHATAKTTFGHINLSVTTLKLPPINPELLPFFQDQKEASLPSTATDSADPPLGIKHSRKCTGLNYSHIKTPTKSFLLLPHCDELGSGSTARVKMAIDLNTNKRVAVKIIDVPDDYPDINNNIRKEIYALKKLGRFVDSCTLIKTKNSKVKKQVYIFQELFDGNNLKHHTQAEMLNLPNGLRAILSVGTELLRLHQENALGEDKALGLPLAYVDLAPRNVLFNPFTKECHATDFGVTAPMGSQRIVIAPDYQPPEAGDRSYYRMKELKPSYDIYLLGVMLKEIFGLESEKEKKAEQPAIMNEIRNLYKLMTRENPEERPSLLHCLHTFLKLYEQVKEEHDIDITLADYRTSSSFLLFMDLFEHLPDFNKTLRRCDTAHILDFPGIKFECDVISPEPAESKGILPSTLFPSIKPEPEKVYIHLNFNGTLQLFKKVSDKFVELTDSTLIINKAGKLEIIASSKSKPDIAADLFAYIKSLPEKAAAVSPRH